MMMRQRKAHISCEIVFGNAFFINAYPQIESIHHASCPSGSPCSRLILFFCSKRAVVGIMLDQNCELECVAIF